MRYILPFNRFVAVWLGLLLSVQVLAQCPTNYEPSFTNASCRGVKDGTITVVVKDGVTPFYFLAWVFRGGMLTPVMGARQTVSDDGRTVVFSGLGGLPAGSSYMISISQQECEDVFTFPINLREPSELLLSVTAKTDVTGCHGDATGSFTVSASGGNGGYTYSFQDGPYTSATTYSSLAAGTYNVKVKDAKGCITESNVTITQPTQLTVALSAQTNPLCAGDATGSITVTASGGTPGYQYTLNGVPAAGAAFSNLAAGSYAIEVIDSKGCKATLPTVTLTNPPVLTAAVNAKTDASCNGATDGSATAEGSGGTAPYSFSWNTTPVQNTATATSLGAGTYTVTVADANACTRTASVTIGQPASVAAPAATNAAICVGMPMPTLTATGDNVKWHDENSVVIATGNTFRPTTTQLDNKVAGTHTFYATQTVGGCESPKAAVTLTVHAFPNPPVASSPAPICTGQEIPALSATGTGIIQWYDNAATLLGTGSTFTPTTIDKSTAGTYTFYVTQTENNCESSATAVTVTIHQTPAKPVVTGTLSFCQGGSTILTSNASTANQWSKDGMLISGATGQTVTVTAPGSYAVTVTSDNGCSATSDAATVTVTAQPAAPAVTNVAYCQGATASALSATGTNLRWYATSTGGTGSSTAPVPSTSVVGSTDYYVSQTVDGCESLRATLTVTINATPDVPAISGSTAFCQGASTSLTSSASAGNQWYRDGVAISGATGQMLTVTQQGTYSVTVTNGSGCPANSAGVTVTQTTVATPTISGTLTFCAGSSTTLTSSAASGNQWNLNGSPIAGAAGQTLNVTAAGNYTVTVTQNGCTATSAAASVTVIPTPAAPVAGSNGPVCAGGTISLTAGTVAGGMYAWTGPNGFASAQQNPAIPNATAAAAGTYSVTVTVNSCTSPAGTVNVTVDPQVATPTISGNASFCRGSNATLTSSAATGNQWYRDGAAVAGATGQTLVVTTGGTYAVTATSGACSATSAPFSVTENAVPTPTINGALAFCQGGSTVLSSSASTGNQWLKDGVAIEGATGQSLTVTAPGNYTVTVTANGCTATSAVAGVTVTPVPAAPTASSNSPVCAGAALNLSASSVAGATYSWTGPNGFTSAAQNPGINNVTIGATGTYAVTVTVNGCTSPAATVAVTINALPATPVISGNNAVCPGGNTLLTSSSATGNQWFKDGVLTNGETGQTLTVTAAGSYSVRVTNAAGCWATSAAFEVSQTPVAVPAITGTFNYCQGGSTLLTSSTASSYQWHLNGNALSGATGQTYTAAAPGDYTVVVTANGCTATSPVASVTETPAPAAPTASSNGPICAGSALNLTASTVSGATYHWTGPNGFTSNRQNPTVGNATTAAAGTYSVTVTVNGCTSPAGTVDVIIHAAPATPVITGTLSFCQGGSTVLTSSASAGNQWYRDGTMLNGETGQTLTAAAAGGYSVRVTNAAGCSATSAVATVTVTAQPAAPAVMNVAYCQNATASALSATGTNLRWYATSTGGTGSSTAPVPSTSVVGSTDYYVSQTVDGCESPRATLTVTVNPSPAAPVASSNGPVCAGSTLNLTASTIAGATYGWTGPNGFTAAGQNVSIPNATTAHSGTYTVTVAVNGCTNAATVNVTVNAQPATPVVSGNTTVCDGSSTVLSSSAATGNQWFRDGAAIAGAVGQNLTVTTAGNYHVVVTSAGRCTAQSAAVTVTSGPGFSVSVTGTNPSSCSLTDGSITATATPSGSYAYSLNGTDFSNTSGVFSGLGAGSYTVYVRNTAGCLEQQSYTLATGTLSVAVSATGETACDATDGTITMTPSGGVSPYVYYIRTGNTGTYSQVSTPEITGLAPGAYGLRVTDRNNCSFEATATVQEFNCSVPSCTLTAGGTKTDPTCGDPDGGSIALTAGGGTNPYAYSLDGVAFQSSNVLIGLSAGTYNQVTVRDAAGCTQVLSFTLAAPAAPSAPAATSPAPLCVGSPVPQLAATGSGLKWYSNAALTTQVGTGSPFTPAVDNTVAGSYSFYVTRTADGCESAATAVSVTFTAPPDFNLNKTDPTGCSTADGTITATDVTGGAGSYQYSINGTTYQAASTFSGLGGGNYTIFVKDANGCIAGESIALTAPGGFTATVTSTNETGCNVSDGTIRVTPGVAGTYKYYINGALNWAGDNLSVFTGLAPGTYAVTVEAANGCTFSSNATVGTDCVTGCSVSASATALVNPTCNGAGDGSLTVSATGGSGTYEYSKDGSTFQASATFTGLAAGDYTITVRDQNDPACRVVLSGIGLTDPSAVTAAVAQTDPTCANNDGGLTITATGGDGVYSYSIDGGGSFSNNNVFSNLSAGTYTVVVKDGKNCSITLAPVALNAGAGLAASVSSTSPTGCNTSDGTITVSNVTGGTGPYSYSLGGVIFQSSSTFSNLPGGSYTVYIRDAKGCQLTRTHTLTAPGGITATTSWTDETACNAADGTITVTSVSGAAGPYQYFINGAADADGIFTSLAPASYTLRVVAANNCEYTTAVTVGTACINPPACTLVAGSSKTDPTCASPDGGSITVTPSGGTAPFAYAFNSATFVVGTGIFTNLPAGNYNITVKDAAGCTYSLNTITLVAPAVPAAPVAASPAPVCAGSTLPTLTATGTDIRWYNGSNAQVGTGGSFTPAVDNTVAGTYRFYATQTVNGCESAKTTVTLTINAGPSAPTVADVAYCQGATPAALSATGSNLRWYTTATGGTGSSTAPVPSTATAGTTDYYVSQTVNGCESPRARITVTVNGNLAAGVNITADQTSVCTGTPVTFTATPTHGGTAPVFQWRINGTNVAGATGATFTSSTLSNSDAVTVVMTAGGDNASCLTGSPATSNAITITVSSSLTASVRIAADQTSICPGTPVTFTATATNGGSAPVFQWRINGISIAGATRATFTSATLANNDVVTVTMAAGGSGTGCISGSPATSNGVTMAVSSSLTASVSIAADQTSICTGTSATFTATAVNGGSAPTYQWRVNGINVAGATNTTFTPGTLADGDRVSVLMTAGGNGIGCISGSPAASNVITMTVSSSLAASVSIVANQNDVCAGTAVTFTATPAHGGTAPVLQWRINGTNVAGATGATFTSSTLRNNDVVTAVMTAGGSNVSCVSGSPATSNAVSMVIKATTDPACGCNLSVAYTATNVRCQGDANGEAVLFVISGGSGSYEYKVGDKLYQENADFKGLPAGTYTFTVRDKVKNCTASTNVTIATNFVVTVLITRTPANTCGGKGSIEFTEISGTDSAPFEVSINGGANYRSWLDNKLFPNLDPATYLASIKDANGCTYTTPIEITGMPAVNAAASVAKQPETCSTSNGEITVAVTGGTAPFRYSVNNGALAALTSNTISGLAAGDYTITVRDANNCEATAAVALAVDPITFTVESGDATCENPQVKVRAVLPAGEDVTKYRFSLNGTDFQSSPEFTVAPADYTMHMRRGGSNSCPVTRTFTVGGVKALTYNVSQVNVGCTGGAEGSITVSGITGGTLNNARAEYGVSIDGGATFKYTGENTLTFNELAPGNYNLVVEYGTGCRTAAREVVISSSGIPFTVLTTPATCGSPNGSAEAVVGETGKRYFYSINNTNFFEAPLFTNLKPGDYKMYIRENANDLCANVLPFIVGGPDSLKTRIRRENCNDIVLSPITGGVKPYRISIDGGNTFVSGNLFTGSYVISNLPDGNYEVVVIDNLGCRTFPVKIRINNTLTAKVKATLSMPDEPTGEIRITDIRGGDGPYEVSLNGTDWAMVKDRSIPYDTTITGQAMGDYVVYLRDANGCVKVYPVEVKESTFLIPNVFTPNNDGVNDTFFIRNLPTGTIVRIVNRWGKVVFESNNYQNDWNGGEYPDGIYYYTVNIAGQGTFSGWVQIWH